jgi:isocitrate lyase
MVEGPFGLSQKYFYLLGGKQNPRFERVTRPYTAAQVVAKRGTLPIQYPSGLLAKKLWATLSGHFKRGTPSHTYGA